MKTRVALILYFLISLSTGVEAQVYRIDNAVEHLEADSLAEAVKDINLAIKHPRTSKFPRTWNYYYLINHKRYTLAESRQERDEFIPLVIEGYKNCKTYDADNQYINNLDSSFRLFTTYFKDNAKQMKNENELESYIYFQENYIACLDALGKPVGYQYFQLGESNMKLRDYELALGDFRHAIQHDFRVEEAYLNVLILLDELDRPKEEELAYVKALSLYPTSDKLHHLDIHKALYKQLSFKAKSAIEELLDQGESSADLYMMLGEANDQMSYKEEAIEAYQMAIKTNPSDFYNCLKVGEYLLSQGIALHNSAYIQQSKQLLEDCQSKSPDDLVLLNTLRRLYIETKNVDEFQKVDAKIFSLTN
ncbi:hypothetical protein [Reichenbachiella sp.]